MVLKSCIKHSLFELMFNIVYHVYAQSGGFLSDIRDFSENELLAGDVQNCLQNLRNASEICSKKVCRCSRI